MYNLRRTVENCQRMRFPRRMVTKLVLLIRKQQPQRQFRKSRKHRHRLLLLWVDIFVVGERVARALLSHDDEILIIDVINYRRKKLVHIWSPSPTTIHSTRPSTPSTVSWIKRKLKLITRLPSSSQSTHFRCPIRKPTYRRLRRCISRHHAHTRQRWRRHPSKSRWWSTHMMIKKNRESLYFSKRTTTIMRTMATCRQG